jgi:hypothetical protein
MPRWSSSCRAGARAELATACLGLGWALLLVVLDLMPHANSEQRGTVAHGRTKNGRSALSQDKVERVRQGLLCVEPHTTINNLFVWLVAGAGLFWEKSTAGWLLMAGLFWEKSTVSWWLISQTNRAQIVGDRTWGLSKEPACEEQKAYRLEQKKPTSKNRWNRIESMICSQILHRGSQWSWWRSFKSSPNFKPNLGKSNYGQEHEKLPQNKIIRFSVLEPIQSSTHDIARTREKRTNQLA